MALDTAWLAVATVSKVYSAVHMMTKLALTAGRASRRLVPKSEESHRGGHGALVSSAAHLGQWERRLGSLVEHPALSELRGVLLP